MKRILPAFAIFTSVVVFFNGCSTQPSDTLTQAEITRLMDSPKSTGYPPLDVKESVFEGVAKEFIVGTVKHLRSPRTSCFDAGGCFDWVPVDIEVKQSRNAEIQGIIMLRVFPSSLATPALDQILVGDRVLAATSIGFIDDNKFDGYSLGWLFKIEADGTLTNLNPESKIKTDLKYVNDVLKTSFK
ncbi:MAG: hypothetical protein RLZ53_51 [Actinomycetota bacterium]|jgi:hypothetical protein